MSKAFTKDDDASDARVIPARPPLPAGATNYVTPRGLESLRSELRALHDARSLLDTAPPDAERTHAVLVANARIRELDERIASAVVVESTRPRDEIRFGARVTVRGESGEERTFEIVGVDEADAAAGRVAFVSPLARALLGKRAGDAVTFRTPRGEEEVEVVAIG